MKIGRLLISGFVPLIPKALGRPRFDKRGFAYQDPKDRAFKNEMRAYFTLHRNQARLKAPDGALYLSLLFQLARPASVKESKRPLPLVKPDIDNFCKAFLDAANEILFLDDSQIVKCLMEKAYSIQPGIHYELFEALPSLGSQ